MIPKKNQRRRIYTSCLLFFCQGPLANVDIIAAERCSHIQLYQSHNRYRKLVACAFSLPVVSAIYARPLFALLLSSTIWAKIKIILRRLSLYLSKWQYEHTLFCFSRSTRSAGTLLNFRFAPTQREGCTSSFGMILHRRI